MKGFLNRLSIRTKLYSGLILITLILTGLTIYTGYTLYRQTLNFEENNINLYLKSLVFNFEKDIKALNDIQIYLSLLSLTQPHSIKTRLQEMDQVENLIVADLSGSIVYSWKSVTPDEAPLFNRFLDDYSGSGFQYEEISLQGKIYPAALTQITDTRMPKTYRSLLILNPEKHSKNLFENLIDPDNYRWNILLVNSKGKLLYHSHEKTIQPSGNYFQKYPSIPRVLSGQTELSLIQMGQEKWYYVSEFIQDWNWYVIVQIPQNIIFKKILTILIPILVIMLIIVTLLILIIGFWAKSFITPLIHLTRSIKEYGENGITAMLEVKGDDEISRSFRTFNQMINERRSLEKEFLDIIEKSRRKIGSILHNELGQLFNQMHREALVLKEELEKNLKQSDRFMMNYLYKILNLLNQSIIKTGTLSNGLNPATIYEGGLAQSLGELLKNFESERGVRIHLKHQESSWAIKQEMISNLFYITYEMIEILLAQKVADELFVQLNSNRKVLTLSISYEGSPPDFSEIQNEIKILNYLSKILDGEILFELHKNRPVIQIQFNHIDFLD